MNIKFLIAASRFGRLIYFCLFLFLTLGVKPFCFSKDIQNPHSLFFFDSSAHLYFAPDINGPNPGVRGAFGYEWRQLRFSLASGLTYVTDANPYLPTLYYIPITFRAGYVHALPWNLSVRAELGLGFRYSEANIYKTVLDKENGILSNMNGFNVLGEGRLSVAWSFLNFWQIFAAGNIYLLHGPLPRYSFETGISLRLTSSGKRTIPRSSGQLNNTEDNLILVEIKNNDIEDTIQCEEDKKTSPHFDREGRW